LNLRFARELLCSDALEGPFVGPAMCPFGSQHGPKCAFGAAIGERSV